jgi:hypothetical protein
MFVPGRDADETGKADHVHQYFHPRGQKIQQHHFPSLSNYWDRRKGG